MENPTVTVRLNRDRVLVLMQERGISQVDLAKRIGAHFTVMSLIMAGRRNPTKEMRRRLLEVFGLEFDELFSVHVDCDDVPESSIHRALGDS